MHVHKSVFNEHATLHTIKHYLPAQAPLKDFIHHNSLHAFQDRNFFDALRESSEIFAYKTRLSLEEFRSLYKEGRIPKTILEHVIEKKVGKEDAVIWIEKAIKINYEEQNGGRIGMLRSNWKKSYQLDLDTLVHPLLFRTLCSYLDQGVSVWDFPVSGRSFLSSLRKMERNSLVSFFKTQRVRDLFLNTKAEIEDLLKILIGTDETLYEQYLFDQQFAHQGWSGMVSMVEDQPQSLLDSKKITLHDLIVFELLLEIDVLEHHNKRGWEPLGNKLVEKPVGLFEPVPLTEKDQVLVIWQEAFEWAYYDQVLAGIQQKVVPKQAIKQKSFQALFCIDDRECSYRRYIETLDPTCETFGTPGFFGVDFYFQPQGGKFYTKVCPAPLTPRHLIKEYNSKNTLEKDIHFSKHSHSFHSGWFIVQAVGFWSALKLFINIFRPSMSPATASSFKHMDANASLTIENQGTTTLKENDLQIGFKVEEMAQRVENVLRSIGLIRDFAGFVYIVGHGASSVNNPHYSAYDCGACSGRAGSVNARVFSYMANHPEVREILKEKGLVIPATTLFIGAIHDTTRDEIQFFDEDTLTSAQIELHDKNEVIFQRAAQLNAKERSRRFESINTNRSPEQIHLQILRRSVSLFEPRPELNHATNALCIVGRRELSKGLFLDRRSFLNSYDYEADPTGIYLLNILNAIAPVCGGINLEYYFSRVDNQKLGAGTKLPHNVMGLLGVANGIDGDLRPGLPSQMVEIHDPIRLLVIVEHFPDVVLDTIGRNPSTQEWFINEWIHLTMIHPDTRQIYRFVQGQMELYHPLTKVLPSTSDLDALLETSQENFPVFILN